MTSPTTTDGARVVDTTDPTVQPVGFGTLLHVELRKTVDTRSGRWLLVGTALATAGIIAAQLATSDADSMTFQSLAGVAMLPQSLLLPVLAVLAATTEWSQRTALTTFTLEPNRARVLLAKLLAVVSIALLAIVTAVAAAAVGAAIGAGLLNGSGAWDVTTEDARDLVILQLTSVLQGFGFATLLMSTPAALVAYFTVPLAWTTLVSRFEALEGVAPWIDLGTASIELYGAGSLEATDWLHLAVASALWVLLPLALGALRLRRREVGTS